MSGPAESVNSIHDMTRKQEALASSKRKQEDGAEGVVSKLPRTRQTKGEIPCNHSNEIASHGDAFSIDKILSPSTKDAELASPRPTRPAKIDPARTTPSIDDKNKTVKNFSEERADTSDVENGANVMPMDKWYDTLLWQQHQQQYQQHLAAASGFYYHQQHFHPHLPNIVSPHQPPAHFSHVPPANGLPLMSGVPPTFCPRMPGRVHLINCQCAEQINEQPYFLLTPAGYSIPSPFQPEQHHYASTRYCRRRKARTVFTEYQIKGLEDRFVYQQYLSTLERVDLARVLFLTEAQVKTWFQNRRMKEKKLSRDTELPFNDDDDDDINDDEEFDEEDEVGDDLDDKCCTKTLRIAPRKDGNDGQTLVEEQNNKLK